MKAKFRGLNKQGEWIYGMPTYDYKYIFNSEQTDSPDNYEVDPKTVTQFTGLYDKDDKEIYEGNILSNEINCKGVVRFCRGMFLVDMIYDENVLSNDNDTATFRLISVASVTLNIGNKFQNPELLEQ